MGLKRDERNHKFSAALCGHFLSLPPNVAIAKSLEEGQLGLAPQIPKAGTGEDGASPRAV